MHYYIAQWFSLRQCLENLPSNTILSCVDFFKSYTMNIQNEVQNMHWHNFQVSILVHISYRQNLLVDPTNPNSIIKEVHYHVFNDPSMIPYLFNMPSCFISRICKVLIAFQGNTLCGQMATQGSSRTHVHGILYHGTLISPHLLVLLMDVH